MRDHLDTLGALRAVAEGRGQIVPPAKFAALIRSGLVHHRGHGARAVSALTDAGRARLASPPASREVVMPHPKEHPLAGRRVVPHFAGEAGAAVYVVDWLDRMPELAALLASDTGAGLAYRARTRGQDLHDSGVVVAGDGRGRCLVHHAELPAYDPVPVGVVS